MYWVKVGDEQYEVLDGQQRTLSVMQYLKHKFPITIDGSKYYWDALPDDKYNAIMDYEFMVYICEGNESEKLEWFKVVNIAGEKLTDQELRNSVYTGAWLSDAKRYFSKRNCAAKGLSDKYNLVIAGSGKIYFDRQQDESKVIFINSSNFFFC